MHLKISSAKWQPFCPGGDELTLWLQLVWMHSHIYWEVNPCASFQRNVTNYCKAQCKMFGKWWRWEHILVGPFNDTYIYTNKLTTNALSSGWHQAIIWTNGGILSIGPLGTNFSENLIKIYVFSSKKMQLKMSSGKWWQFYLDLCVHAYMYQWTMSSLV